MRSDVFKDKSLSGAACTHDSAVLSWCFLANNPGDPACRTDCALRTRHSTALGLVHVQRVSPPSSAWPQNESKPRSYLASIIPQNGNSRLIVEFVQRACICSLIYRKPLDSGQDNPLVDCKSRPAIMATHDAAFDMADFVDFGDTSIPGVSQGTDLNITEPALDQRCVVYPLFLSHSPRLDIHVNANLRSRGPSFTINFLFLWF